MSNSSVFQYLLNNMLFSNKVINCKNHKCLIHELTTKCSASMTVSIETVLFIMPFIFWHHGPRRHRSVDQQYLATGFKQDVFTGKLPLSWKCRKVSSAGCNRETGRVTERINVCTWKHSSRRRGPSGQTSSAPVNTVHPMFVVRRLFDWAQPKDYRFNWSQLDERTTSYCLFKGCQKSGWLSCQSKSPQFVRWAKLLIWDPEVESWNNAGWDFSISSDVLSYFFSLLSSTIMFHNCVSNPISYCLKCDFYALVS